MSVHMIYSNIRAVAIILKIFQILLPFNYSLLPEIILHAKIRLMTILVSCLIFFLTCLK